MTTALLDRPLATGDRFELTDEARPKVRPRGQPSGVIVADQGDCWKVRFDGNSFTRVVLKAFIRAEPSK